MKCEDNAYYIPTQQQQKNIPSTVSNAVDLLIPAAHTMVPPSLEEIERDSVLTTV